MSSSHPLATQTATASTAARDDNRSMGIPRFGFMTGASSECDLDDGREGPELRILEPVHFDLERIAEETRYFRIEPGVVGNREQVAANEAEPQFLHPTQSDLPQLV